MNFFDSVRELIKKMLIENISSNLESLLGILNENVEKISSILSTSPKGFNYIIFSFIKEINDTVIIPIVGLIITAFFCINIIQMVTKKNKMQEVDSYDIYKLIFSTFIWLWLLTRAFEFTLAIFDISAKMIRKSANIINTSSSININNMNEIINSLNNMNNGELFMLSGLIALSKIIIFLLSIVVLVICYVRIIEIYLYSSVCSLAFATLGSEEYSGIGKNFIKNLIALGLQAVLIIVCVGIYGALIKNTKFDSNIEKSIGEIFLYTFILGITIFKTGTVSKSIVTAS